MSSNKVFSAALLGLDAETVEIESDLTTGAIAFHIVGLADKSIDEARERIRSAIKNSGLFFPRSRVTINLAPADLKKFGSAYDFPIAVSILLSSGTIPENKLIEQSILLGELGLDGNLRAVSGVLPITAGMKNMRLKHIFLPTENAQEASLVKGIKIYPLKNLNEFILHMKGKNIIPEYITQKEIDDEKPISLNDFAHIKGQIQAKRAMMIAASGGHNLLFYGSPGCGKTMLSRAMPGILPSLSQEESLEVTKIYSVAGLLLRKKNLVKTRPFRSPHHSSSAASIIGGGRIPGPGEVSLAHRGVLFLDEFAEFPKYVLENLRQPMEDGNVTVSRVYRAAQFPCRFILVAAMNPCPCGYYNDPDHTCACSHFQIQNYQKKISGPILDRIDLHIEVPKVNFEELYESKDDSKFSSQYIQNQVVKIRETQSMRFKNENIFTNAEMNAKLIEKHCGLDKETLAFFKDASNRLSISARTSKRILKISRTIADIENSDKIKLHHLSEALQYRPKVIN